MAQSDAHLLRIPREIRDQILNYVHHEATFPWRWSCSRKGRLVFNVTIPCAPQLSILLTCSRLYEEYMQQRKDKSMVIHWNGRVKKRHTGKRINKDQKYIKAFRHVENIKVVVDLTLTSEEGMVPWTEQGTLYCQLVKRLFEFFTPYTAQLSSIVIVSRKVAAVRDRDTFGQPVGPKMRPEDTSTGLVLDRLSGLLLVHFAHALCFYSSIEHWYSWGWTDQCNSVKNSIYQIQVRYYANDPHKILLPTPREVQATWKSYIITREKGMERRPLKKHEMQAFDEAERRMWGWQDFSGDRVYAAKDVFREDFIENDGRLDPYAREHRERAEEPVYYQLERDHDGCFTRCLRPDGMQRRVRSRESSS